MEKECEFSSTYFTDVPLVCIYDDIRRIFWINLELSFLGTSKKMNFILDNVVVIHEDRQPFSLTNKYTLSALKNNIG